MSSLPLAYPCDMARATIQERFWPKVNKNGPMPSPYLGPCWVWAAALYRSGYGAFRADDKARRAHIVAYELVAGPVPDGLELDHLCRNKACVNPAHLEPVTRAVNLTRGIGPSLTRARRKPHCKRGHEYDNTNTYVDPAGRRHCRICRDYHRGRSRAKLGSGQ